MTRKSGFQKTNYRPDPLKVVERELAPKVQKEKDGSMVLLCPHCPIPHIIRVDQPSACGTLLRVVAVQPIYKAKYFKEMICAKCGKDGGEMVQQNQGFIHANNCVPGLVTLNDPPPFSKTAKWVYNMKPSQIKELLKKNLGTPQPVYEQTPEGAKTDIILGYVFYWSDK